MSSKRNLADVLSRGATIKGGLSSKMDSMFGVTQRAQESKIEVVKEQLNEVQQGFVDRAKQDNQRFMDAVDSEYWFCVCFNTREQKDEFLKRCGWDTDDQDKYIDGVALSGQLGIKIPPSPVRRMPKMDRALQTLVKPKK